MSGHVKVCDIKDDVKDALKKFRFRKNENNAALILKVDREKQEICIDEILEDISIDELRESLPSHQPRYIVYSYKMTHNDGRISYPMCFIYFTPRALQKEADLTRVYEIRELDELTEDWLQEKLSK
ncbi:Glia maturation factor beta, putative [Pediculus humanus corporis]|uniref:Glia maturation factor beta, putative n=1 Tax=Pediculus humanus subsp. corporis TaxID=121224 RepID=E0VNZ9_PEDHC|nr:Glia maturation factor beta, putative [Pediculus humanus corporis]EEB15105.1 Glia maturation factor beta, putative [Pediculus humanus corporis]